MDYRKQFEKENQGVYLNGEPVAKMLDQLTTNEFVTPYEQWLEKKLDGVNEIIDEYFDDAISPNGNFHSPRLQIMFGEGGLMARTIQEDLKTRINGGKNGS